MAAIHHNTIKKAAKFGITVTHDGTEYVAEAKGQSITLGNGPEAQAALVAALAELEGQSRKPRLKTPAKPKKRKAVRKPRDDEEEGDDEEETEEGEASRSVVKKVYKQRYRPHKHKCGDDIAKQVSAHVSYKDEDKKVRTDKAKLKRFAIANGCWDPKYAHLNNGMQRMNIVNRLRAKVRKGHEIVWAQ